MTNDTVVIASVVDKTAAALGRACGLQGADIDDLRQEGWIAALEARAAWEPARGLLAAYLYPRVKGSMLTYLAKDGRKGITGAALIAVDFTDIDDIVKAEESGVGGGLIDESLPEAHELVLEDQVRGSVNFVPLRQRRLLVEYFGLDGRKPMTLQEIADKRRTTKAIVYRMLNDSLSMIYLACRLKGIDADSV